MRYVTAVRLDRARRLLRSTDLPVVRLGIGLEPRTSIELRGGADGVPATGASRPYASSIQP